MELDAEKHADLIVSLHDWWNLIGEAYRIGLPHWFSVDNAARLQPMGDAGILNADLSMTAAFRKAMDEALTEQGAAGRQLVIRAVAARYHDWYRPAFDCGGGLDGAPR